MAAAAQNLTHAVAANILRRHTYQTTDAQKQHMELLTIFFLQYRRTVELERFSTIRHVKIASIVVKLDPQRPHPKHKDDSAASPSRLIARLRPAGSMTLFSSTSVANTSYKRSPAFSPTGEMHWLLRRMVTERNKKHRGTCNHQGDPPHIAQLQSIVSDRQRVFSWTHLPLVQVGALNRRPSQVKESSV